MEINEVVYTKSKLTGKREVTYLCPQCDCSLSTPVQEIVNGDTCPDCSVHFNFSRSAKISVKKKILSERAAEEDRLLKAEEKKKQKQVLSEQRTQQKKERAKEKLLAQENKLDELGGRYTKSSLGPEEKVLYCGQLHWKIFIWPLILILIGIIWTLINFQYGAIFFIVALTSFFIAIIKKSSSEYAVTDRKVVVKQGFITRQTLELKLTKIDSLSVSQGLLDRILNCGDINITVAVEKQKIRDLRDPIRFKKAVDEALPH